MVGLSLLTQHWATQRVTVHIDRMPIYTVLLRADCVGFDIEITDGDGSCQIIHGCKTMADVHACIAHNKPLADPVHLGEPSSFRTSW